MGGSRGRTGAAALGVAALLALGLGGCGGGGAGGPASAEPLGEKLGGSVATLVDCGDWAGGPRARKLATIADIRSQVNRDDTGIEAPPLSDDEAMALFDNECAKGYARGFRLYVLYARAAGWAPLLREAERRDG